jgi:protein involved in polysaccharide export with SLBB domain
MRGLAAAAIALAALAGTTAVSAQATAAAPVRAAPAAEYRLGAGDVVRITVFQNPELTLESRLTEGGQISFPLLGAVRLGGLSVPEAEKVLFARKCNRFLDQYDALFYSPTIQAGNSIDVPFDAMFVHATPGGPSPEGDRKSVV